jgi:outer membrane protein assembly factor BamB
MTYLRPARRVATLALGCLAMCACGGGGGGGGGSAGAGGGGNTSQPKIVATVVSFPTGASPQGFLPSGFNTDAGVQITAQDGSAITTASVSVNGTTLNYSAQVGQYLAAINVAPGAQVAVSVEIAGVSYNASLKQFSAYPTILTPTSGSTWSIASDNLASWSGATPDSSSQYALGVFDTAGNLLYPSNGSFLALPGSQNSSVIPANSISLGSRLLLVGILDVVPVSGAAQGSGLAVGGFNYSGITVQEPAAALTAVAVTPQQVTVSPGKTVQVTAQGTYADGSTLDITGQATWTSSDTSKVTVSNTGVISGVAGGDADVTAALDGMSGVVHAHVFVPNPSPTPPLSQSVAFQIDYAHSGFTTVGGSGPTFPPTATWSATLNGPVSYPVIAGGLVIVTTGVNASDPTAYGTSLYALSLATGAVVWGPLTITGTYAFSAAAYDHGNIFVVNEDGTVQAFVAATGASLWTVTPPAVGPSTVAPTAVNGVIYVGGLTALDEVDGSVIWNAGTGGGKGAPTVSNDGVFVSVPCNVFKYDPLVGTPLWHYAGGCFGGGGVTAPYSNGKLYIRDTGSMPPDQVFDAESGAQLGSFGPSEMPAFSPTTGFFVSSNETATASTLTAIDQVSGNTLWTYQAGYVATPPVVIDGIVVVADQTGKVYAIDATSGTLVWSGTTGTPLLGTDEQNANQLTGLGAGEGWLVVPAGNSIVAWKVTS